jgi:capsular exopolysaccharide synthesis family protein
VSRIYDAMKRGAALEASRRSLAVAGPEGAPLVDRVAEGYQQVLHAIQSRLSAKPGCSMLIVSAVHGEGTSTVARELAALLCRDGLTRAVLVDANLRTPSQHKAFGVERAGGLTEVVTRGLALDQAVRNGNRSPVPLLTSGRPASHPAGVLGAPALRTAIEGLRAKYDWVIVDGPPTTVYSDAGILAPLMDGVVLVVQAEKTRWQVAEQAKRMLEASGARLLGAVLSRQRFHIPEALYGLL